MGRRPQIVLEVLERYVWNALELSDSMVSIPEIWGLGSCRFGGKLAIFTEKREGELIVEHNR